jgi:hypothetical protein
MLQNMWDLNSIFGTPEDLTSLVSAIHSRGKRSNVACRAWPGSLVLKEDWKASSMVLQQQLAPDQ